MRCYVFLSDEFHSRDLRINNINFITDIANTL